MNNTPIDVSHLVSANTSLAPTMTPRQVPNTGISKASENHFGDQPVNNVTEMTFKTPPNINQCAFNHLDNDTPATAYPSPFNGITGDGEVDTNHVFVGRDFHIPVQPNQSTLMSYYQAAWDLTAFQLDCATTFVKVPQVTYMSLGPMGVAYFREQFRITTGLEAEFFDDAFNNTEGPQQDPTLRAKSLPATVAAPIASPCRTSTSLPAPLATRQPRAMNSFLHWALTMREVIRIKTRLPFIQVSKLLSVLWAQVDVEEKARQTALAHEAAAEWARTHPIVNGKPLRSRKRKSLKWDGASKGDSAEGGATDKRRKSC
ncbi:hypothetical protein GGR57DRAFT_517217 [Xylariaceae sp. FL1272]|nr:hypothetical protein GGR57DRAFT_517217 [Xylariaceae sp. FL1272]